MRTAETALKELMQTARVGGAAAEGPPLVVEPWHEDLATNADVVARWFDDHHEALQALLPRHGAILLRGFAIPDTAAFNTLVDRYDTDPNGYAGGMASRGQIAGKVFEASRLPADQHLIMHQEMGYLPNYPRQIIFYCAAAAVTGGATTLVDIRRFAAALPPRLLDAIRDKGVLYRRAFRCPEKGDANDIRRPWTEVMQVASRDEAERTAADIGCEARWHDDGSLSLEYRASGFARHAVDDEEVWFAQVPSMHVNRTRLSHNYSEAAIDRLFEQFPVGRPRPVEILYGDGSAIPDELVTPLYSMINRIAVNIPYRDNDMLMVDNLYTAHGRQPFIGKRDVQVALVF